MSRITRKIQKLFPSRYHFVLMDIKNLLSGFRHTHYSQNGEDIILTSLFRSKRKGFYVDVGAHHPKRYSNTFLLYKKGWRGINIDPNPTTIRMFKRIRRRDINIETAISKKKGTLSYYDFSDPAVNTFSEEQASRWMNKDWIELVEKRDIHVVPLKDVLDIYMPQGTTIDIMNVDVEGLDLEVLESNDWKKYRPKVIVIESENFDVRQPSANSIYSFLDGQGYDLKHVLKFSLIFVDSHE